MTDEFPLTDQTRGQRKAIKVRRKAHEKAQKHRNKSGRRSVRYETAPGDVTSETDDTTNYELAMVGAPES
jgi:hypothetical protein